MVRMTLLIVLAVACVVCQICGEIINNVTDACQASGQMYHSSCFLCTSCGKHYYIFFANVLSLWTGKIYFFSIAFDLVTECMD